MRINPYRIDYSESKYLGVSSLSTDTSGGTVFPNNQIVVISRFRANGVAPDQYVRLVWDDGGANEKIFCSTRGDVDLYFDTSNPDMRITGDGSKSLKIILVNAGSSLSPVFGGAYEVTIVG